MSAITILKFRFYPAEILALAASGFLLFLSIPLAIYGTQGVAWNEFLLWNAFALALILDGLRRRMASVSNGAANAMIAVGLLFNFGSSAALLNYLLFPIEREMIDSVLFRIDLQLGYFWSDFVHYFDTIPLVGLALSYIYNSALFQVLGVIILLGVTGRQIYLHRFMVAGTVSVCLTLAIWWLAPSIGPSAYFSIPNSISANINLVVDSAYGEELKNLVQEGTSTIKASKISGVIAFPSLHTVMACMVVVFTLGTQYFLPALALNAPMIPATLAHGGHHLSDVFGGIIVFLVALFIAAWFVPASGGQRAAMSGNGGVDASP